MGRLQAGAGSRLAGLLLGLLLVAAGMALLAVQLLGYEVRFDLVGLGWPIYVIVPGLILLVVGLIVDREPGVGLSIAGGIVTTVGLILAYQWATDHWASWAYAWALVAPTSVGAAMTLWGLLHLSGRALRAGLGTMTVGLILFLLFFGFFEGLLGIGGDRGLAPLGRSALPLALIVAGVLVIAGRLWPRRSRPTGPAVWQQGHPASGQRPQEAVIAPPLGAERSGTDPTETGTAGADAPGSEPAEEPRRPSA
jgi:hypothetical protein